jgi:hypothetical protein
MNHSKRSINYALRVLKPVFDNQLDAVELTKSAQDEYSRTIQATLPKRVWKAGSKGMPYTDVFNTS